MKIPWFATLLRSMRWLRKKIAPRVVILLYHRVVEVPSDPQLLSVTPQHFVEHLEILRKWGYRILPLQQLVQTLRNRSLPHRAVVLTFDDGYSDNLWKAKPLLERYDVPATVFVTAGYVGENKVFWWDELSRLLLRSGTLPNILKLSLKGSCYQWELGKAAHWSDDDYNCNRYWNVMAEDYPSSRHRIYHNLCQLLIDISHAERDAVLAELADWAGGQVTMPSEDFTLTTDQLTELAEGKLIDIGAHTVTHPILADLPLEAQREEIFSSKKRLEDILGERISCFSYPFGRRGDYTGDTVRLVRDAGFDCACSNFPCLVTPKSDPYQLPRFLGRDWDGEEFAYRLDGFFGS